MKVVLFCGGFGMRMRGSGDDRVPKPMQLVGDKPLLWHVMRYYAHFGHRDFLLCLGYGAEHIKRFFLNHDAISNDFVLEGGQVRLLNGAVENGVDNWRITFLDTGPDASIGDRLRSARPYLKGEEMFLANYADVLTDANLDSMVDHLKAEPDAAGSLMAVPPQQSFHVLNMEGTHITSITPVSEMAVRENGGYLVFRQAIFDYFDQGRDIMEGSLAAAEAGRLIAYPHDGFWKPADTFKERAELDQLWAAGQAPWALWREGNRSAKEPAVKEPAIAR